MEYFDVINEKDEVIQVLPRSEVYKHLHQHRIVHILIFNDQGEMLLQKRSKNTRYKPLAWSTSVGGHINAGESYEDAGLREYQEELGTTSPLKLLGKDWYINTDTEYKDMIGHKKILCTFTSINNGPFAIDKNDVEEVAFFPLAEIKKMIHNDEKFHPELLFLLKKYYTIS